MKSNTCFVNVLIIFLWLTLQINLNAKVDLLINKISWLSGCWKMIEGDLTIRELWMTASGGMMIGMSQSVSNDKTSGFEFLRIEEQDGKLVYTAIPSGQTETSFYQVELNDTLAVFENLEHDFPQRIIYTLINKDSLNARVEAVTNGKLEGFDIPMRKTDCTN